MTFGFGFSSVLYGVEFISVRVLEHFFTFVFGFRSVLGKTWVLVRFVLAGFGFFPISSYNYKAKWMLTWHKEDQEVCRLMT